MRNDRALGTVSVLATYCTAMIVYVLVYVLIFGTVYGHHEHMYVYVYGRMSGLAVAFMFVLAVAVTRVPFGGASRRYRVFLYCPRGRLPRGLDAFLHWAYPAGLLRISGVAYQFRHRELQDWLAAHPVPLATIPR